MPNERIEQAETEAEVIDNQGEDRDEDRELFLGDPSAFSQDSQLLHENAAEGIPGCNASVECECGQRFALDLLNESLSICPGCQEKFTHLLVVCRDDDPYTALHVIGHIFRENNQLPDENAPDLEPPPEEESQIPKAKTEK